MYKNSPTLHFFKISISGFTTTTNDKPNSSSSTEAHRFISGFIPLSENQVSYEPTESKEPHKPTDLFLPILLLTPEETTTFALVVNSYWSLDLSIRLLDFYLSFYSFLHSSHFPFFKNTL